MFFFFESNNDSFPTHEDMIKPLLVALTELGGKAKIKEIDEKTIEIMNLPDDIISVLHKGSKKRTEIEYRLAWTRTYLKKYGLINNTGHGVWELSPLYNGDIENLDTATIVRAVKLQQNHLITNIESSIAFENLVRGIIKEQLIFQKKALAVEEFKVSNNRFDLLLPEGIDDIDSDLYCEIKYINPQTQNFSQPIIEILNRFYKLNVTGHMLIIINKVISKKVRSDIDRYAQYNNNENFIIWDGNDLSKRMEPDSDYTKYFINPKQAIVEDTISTVPSVEEETKLKNEFLSQLRSSYNAHNLILFLGAGVSIGAGIPLWSGLIKKLLINMINKRTTSQKLSEADKEFISEIAYSNQENSPLTQMRYIKSSFSEAEYLQSVHEVLYSEQTNLETELLGSLAKISAPQRGSKGIKSIVTYNFDDLLERKLIQRGIEDFNIIYQDDDISMVEKLNIYHVHGYLPFEWDSEQDANLIFSEEDYHKVYRDSFSWSNLIQLNAFRDNTCLFIGCSLTDPNLRRLLDVATRNNESPRHYVILRKKNSLKNKYSKKKKNLITLYERIDDNIRKGFFTEIGLNVIWVDSFDEIPAILDSIRE